MAGGDTKPASAHNEQIWVSIIILNYNGATWLPRCIQSLIQQTVFSHSEIIVADNTSTDGSDRLSEQLLAGVPNGLFIQNGCNPGFGAGSNLAVKRASGKYLFFLNPDVWLEPDCLELLYQRAEATKAAAAGLLILDYDDDSFQSSGATGFDLFGHIVAPRPGQVPDVLFVCVGFYFIRRETFDRVGGYDGALFLYGEELDLSWRVWLAGETIIHVPTARLHHRGAAAVNPKGGTKVVELRTSDSKRFYANRNHLLTISKNAQHILLLLLVPALLVTILEGLIGAVVFRRWSFFSQTCWAAIRGWWQLRGHVSAERRRIRTFRKRGDFWMLRFFSWRLNRWEELQKMRNLGLPKVDSR